VREVEMFKFVERKKEFRPEAYRIVAKVQFGERCDTRAMFWRKFRERIMRERNFFDRIRGKESGIETIQMVIVEIDAS
jgi:hypothetical protein